MYALRRIALLAAMTLTSWPAAAIAQEASADSLVRRVELLEQTISELAARVRQLEAQVGSEPAQVRALPPTATSRELQNWRRLRRGMKMDEVRALLGEPARVQTLGPVATYWYWEPAGSVQFDGRDKLEGWVEP